MQTSHQKRLVFSSRTEASPDECGTVSAEVFSHFSPGSRDWQPRGMMVRLQAKRQDSALPIRVSTLNHVSFGCDDLKSTDQWYGRVFGMAVHAFQDYGRGQTVLRIGIGPAYIALSQRNAKTRTRQGDTVEILVNAPDGIEIQLQDISYCGGRGRLGQHVRVASNAYPRGSNPRTLSTCAYRQGLPLADLLARLRRAIWFYLPTTRCRSFSLSRQTDSSRSPSRYSCGTIVTVQGLVYALGSSNVN